MKRNRTLILLLAFLSPFFIAGAVVSFQQYRRVAEEFYRQESRLKELYEERGFLQEKIERLSSPAGIEREARMRFNLIREGETMVILISPPIPAPAPDLEQQPSFFEKILQWIRWW
jgi:cell division protein FtsB